MEIDMILNGYDCGQFCYPVSHLSIDCFSTPWITHKILINNMLSIIFSTIYPGVGVECCGNTLPPHRDEGRYKTIHRDQFV